MAQPRPKKVSEQTRQIVLARASYKCERCNRDFLAFPVSVHHRRPRMMGGSKNQMLHEPANLIVLCGTGIDGCHGWVESNRAQARDQGFLIQKIELADQIPFQDLSGVWFQIDNQGEKTELDIVRSSPHA